VLRLLRKLVCERVLREDTFRQDNAYGNVTSHLSVNEPVAARLGSGGLRIVMPFLVKAPAEPEQAPAAAPGGAARKKAAAARGRGGREGTPLSQAPAAGDDVVEVIEDDEETDDGSGVSQVPAACQHLCLLHAGPALGRGEGFLPSGRGDRGLALTWRLACAV
jgi:hypothetical protein